MVKRAIKRVGRFLCLIGIHSSEHTDGHRHGNYYRCKRCGVEWFVWYHGGFGHYIDKGSK